MPFLFRPEIGCFKQTSKKNEAQKTDRLEFVRTCESSISYPKGKRGADLFKDFKIFRIISPHTKQKISKTPNKICLSLTGLQCSSNRLRKKYRFSEQDSKSFRTLL